MLSTNIEFFPNLGFLTLVTLERAPSSFPQRLCFFTRGFFQCFLVSVHHVVTLNFHSIDAPRVMVRLRGMCGCVRPRCHREVDIQSFNLSETSSFIHLRAVHRTVGRGLVVYWLKTVPGRSLAELVHCNRPPTFAVKPTDPIPESDLPNLVPSEFLTISTALTFRSRGDLNHIWALPYCSSEIRVHHSPTDNPASPAADLLLASVPVYRSHEREIYGVPGNLTPRFEAKLAPYSTFIN